MSYGNQLGAGAGGGVRVGIFAYSDLATATTELELTGGVPLVLTNDTLGPQTLRSLAPAGVTNVWLPDTDRFDFTEMSIGDVIDLRIDLDVVTSAANQEFEVKLMVAEGGFTYEVPMYHDTIKTSGASIHVSPFSSLYIGDANTLDNPAYLEITSASDLSITVNGWYTKLLVH